jgi:hypothetical protein
MQGVEGRETKLLYITLFFSVLFLYCIKLIVMKYKFSKERFMGWFVTILMIGTTFITDVLPPRFTEFYEGDIALSYSVHDTVPYSS